MLKKLKNLGAVISSVDEKHKKECLHNYEQLVGDLPLDYKWLVLIFGGDIKFDFIVEFSPIKNSPWSSENGTDMLELLYGLTSSYQHLSLIDVFNTYKDRIPNGYIPIGESSGGNQICMCINVKHYGEIYFWDHEGDIGNSEPPLYLISHTLKEFIAMLKKDNYSYFNSDDVKVELDF